VSEYYKIYCSLKVILAVLHVVEMIKFRKEFLSGPAVTRQVVLVLGLDWT